MLLRWENDLPDNTLQIFALRHITDAVLCAAIDKGDIIQMHAAIFMQPLLAAPRRTIGIEATILLAANDGLIPVDDLDGIPELLLPKQRMRGLTDAARCTKGIRAVTVFHHGGVKQKGIVVQQLEADLLIDADALCLLLTQSNGHAALL